MRELWLVVSGVTLAVVTAIVTACLLGLLAHLLWLSFNEGWSLF